MAQAVLQIRSPHGNYTVAIGAEPLTLGRLSENAVVLNDGMASRHHCVIETTPTGLRVRDLNSRNGTVLNGVRIDTQKLFDKDVITIGQYVITVVDPAHRRPSAPAKAPAAKAAGTVRPPPPPIEAEPDSLSLDDLAAVESADADQLSEEDVVEELSEEDVADDVVLDDLEVVESEDEDAPIHIPLDDDVKIEIEPSTGDFQRVLDGLVDAMPEPRVSESEIALVNARGQVVHPSGVSRRQAGAIDAVETLRIIMLICLRSRGTDIHFDPKQGQTQVRIRVDGVMVEIVKIDDKMGTRINALVKVLSDIDIAQKNVIQEGHFSSMAPTIENGRLKQPHRIDYRVSFAPAVHGQKLVIRVLDTTNAPLTIDNLNLPKWMHEKLGQAIQQESGMVLVCGPTGSGKTTSLYALLRSLDVNSINVMTIEDPVEIELPGVTQVPVDDANGKGFGALLRSLLRQDPDVILVGEVRDAETARTAMQAAITGHLVFSTLHTKDSVGTIFRLLDLGVEPYLIAQGLHVVLAQRLVRQLCPYCKVPVAPTPEQQEKLSKTVGKLDRIYAPRGCPKCLNTGYMGRRGFFELLSATDQLRDVILKQPTLEQIQKSLEGTPFKRLDHSGHLMVKEGVASFDEIDRAVSR